MLRHTNRTLKLGNEKILCLSFPESISFSLEVQNVVGATDALGLTFILPYDSKGPPFTWDHIN